MTKSSVQTLADFTSGKYCGAEARTCYLHLAGRLGVAWLDTLEERHLIHLSGGAPAGSARSCVSCIHV